VAGKDHHAPMNKGEGGPAATSKEGSVALARIALSTLVPMQRKEGEGAEGGGKIFSLLSEEEDCVR